MNDSITYYSTISGSIDSTNIPTISITSASTSDGYGLMSIISMVPLPAGYLVLGGMRFSLDKMPNKFHQFMMNLFFGWKFELYTISVFPTTTIINNSTITNKTVPSTLTGKQLLLD